MGPTSSASVCIDLSHLKDGDCAGFAAFNSDSGLLTVKKKGKRLVLEMSEQKVELTEREKAVTAVEEKIIESVDLKQNKIWLRIDADFRPIGGIRSAQITSSPSTGAASSWALSSPSSATPQKKPAVMPTLIISPSSNPLEGEIFTLLLYLIDAEGLGRDVIT